MSQNHAVRYANWSLNQLESCRRALRELVDPRYELVAIQQIEPQGAINTHWRLQLHAQSPDAPSSSLILRACPRADHTAPGHIPTFPADHLNAMRRQQIWHDLAWGAGVKVPRCFGVLSIQGLGDALLLDDLGPQWRCLPDLLRSAPRTQEALWSAALGQLVKLHSAQPNPEAHQWFAPPPVPAIDPKHLALHLGRQAPDLLEDLMAQAGKLAEELPTARHELVALHGDFRSANIWLDHTAASTEAVLLDFDFAGFGPAVQDLAWLTAPCWCLPEQRLELAWVRERYEELGGSAISARALMIAQLQAQLRWLAIALLQCRRHGQTPDQLYANEPQQHPRQVLVTARDLARALG